ncbi:MAG: flavin-containing monooxygenase [Gammaproteobacteria bacterium]
MGATQKLDALVVGAGVAGLYQLYQLRNQGLNVKLVDTATDVGGTWYWNRYPGARFDSEGFIYQYLFSEELYKEWSWSERFPGQPEIERWLQWVAEKLELRPDIQFESTVTNARFNEDTQRWSVEINGEDEIDAQFLISCTGMLSAPLENQFKGQDTFNGQIFHTARWPKEPVDFSGKRVGMIGIGATGIQVIQTIAKDVGHMTIFVRTPQYVNIMKNPKHSDEDIKAYKDDFENTKEWIPRTFSGFNFDFDPITWADHSPEERQARLEEVWQHGSLKLWLASYMELFFDEEVNEEISEFVRNKMRERLKDPALCELLIPKDYGYGTHRVPLENNYLEVYLQDNVDAVSVKDNPIECIVPEGIKLADGTVYECDIVIMATGFDAGSGALTRMNIQGRDNRSLTDQWNDEIRIAYGLAIHGYPNLFTTGAPLAPSAALCNMTTCLQQQTEWISGLIDYARNKGATTIEASKELEDEWVEHHDEVANATLLTKTDSWYMGSNVEGKPRRLLSYAGGVGTYREKCEQLAESGYKGFDMQ